MNNKKNGIPKLRFPGFTGAWEQRKLGEILKERKERSSIGELISVTINNGVVKADSLERKDNSSSDKSNYKVVCKGDIAYNSMRMWQGASGYSPYNGILSPAYTVLIPTEKVDSKFISYMFKKEKMLQQFQKYSQGLTSDTWNLKYPMLKDIPVLFPKIDEQVSIRKHLDNISSLIALHQRKLEHLQEQKKGLLQKMFPKNGETVPEVRFPGFTDAWEQRKWVDSINISNEMVDPTTGKFDDMPHIAPGNIESFTGRILDNVKTVKEEELISGKFLFKPGDVVFGKINPQLGKYFYARVEGLTSADSYVLNGKNKNITQMFIFLLLQTRDFFKYSVSVSKRSGIPKINREELNGFKFLIPCKEEQEKIGDFFLNIDSLIALHQRKLDHLELMKKGLLQQMFV